MQALVLAEDTEAKTQQRAPYHPVRLATVPIPVVKEDQVLVKLIAAAFNHRQV
jgi:NADPH:quinone reductase-like Zn-dependent oxidoreductase